jgi:SAM-dependent methyltransferase
LNILLFGYAMLWCLSFGKRPMRFAAGVAALFFASTFYPGSFGHILHTERSFYGVSRVTNDMDGKFRYLFHGGTIHGIQSLDETKSDEPLAYYTRSGPAGDIFRAQQARLPNGDLAIVGLGAGAMACHLAPGERLTYYEIDPSVTGIAENPQYFTFLSHCAPNARIILGDARLKFRDAPDGHYGLIALDAFSGDTIPMHLVTREALELYQRKLAPGGILVFHISNLYLEMSPILSALADDAHLKIMIADDNYVSPKDMEDGKFPSRWIVMARSEADVEDLAKNTSSPGRWVQVERQPGTRVWTDDYSNLFSIIKWH